jgi:glycosyltransferase involved in cell wall biosynthesis
MTPRVSVVVPTYRRPELLRRCLAALAAQDFAPADYEIIVVDDAGDEATRRLVEGREWARSERTTEVVTTAGTNGHGLRGDDFGRPNAATTEVITTLSGNGHGLRSDDFSRRSDASATEAVTTLCDNGDGLRSDGCSRSDASATEVLTTETGDGHRGRRRKPPSRRREERGVPQPPVSSGGALPVVRYLAAAQTHGPAAARNRGWQAGRGEIVAFTDDDCIPAPGWLRAGVAAFTAEVLGVSGRVVMPLDGIPTDYERDATGLARSQFVTANCFYRRSVLEMTGGFDERFTAAWREDTDLYFTLLSQTSQGTAPAPCLGQNNGRGPFAGTRLHLSANSLPVLECGALVFAPGALVLHPIRPATWGVSLRQQRKNFFNALLYKKHPGLYREFIQPVPPTSYYATLAAGIAAIAGPLLGQPRWGLGGLLLWSALTARFCSRRLRGTVHTPRHILEMAVTSALIPPAAVFWRLAGAIKFRVPFL